MFSFSLSKKKDFEFFWKKGANDENNKKVKTWIDLQEIQEKMFWVYLSSKISTENSIKFNQIDLKKKWKWESWGFDQIKWITWFKEKSPQAIINLESDKRKRRKSTHKNLRQWSKIRVTTKTSIYSTKWKYNWVNLRCGCRWWCDMQDEKINWIKYWKGNTKKQNRSCQKQISKCLDSKLNQFN